MKAAMSLLIFAVSLSVSGQAPAIPHGGQPYGKNNPGPVDSRGQTEWVKRLMRTSPTGISEENEIEAPRAPVRSPNAIIGAGGAGNVTYGPGWALTPSPEILKMLKVKEHDFAAQKGLFAGGKAGVFKLLPQVDCTNVKEKDLIECSINRFEVFYYANSYSFQDNSHGTAQFGDFSLIDGALDARSSNKQTILANLGDVRLEDVTLNSDHLKYLTAFCPQSLIEDAQKQFSELEKGVAGANRIVHSKTAAVNLNDTLILRAIAYPIKGKNSSKDTDILVVMRVVKKDADGSLTIVWRELDRRAPPMVFYRAS